MPAMNLGKRIESQRLALGWEHKDILARVPGLSQQSLSGLVTRDSKTSEHAFAIADALGVSARWLMTGVGPKDATDWPFQRVTRARWEAATPEDRAYIQGAVNKLLDTLLKKYGSSNDQLKLNANRLWLHLNPETPSSGVH